MTGLQGARLIVAGAGALGLSIAFTLARSGAAVTLADPAPLADNASGVAAGMLAPAFEAVLDESSVGRFALLKAARDLWPAFAEQVGEDIGLTRSGALWVDIPGVTPRLDDLRQALVTAGAHTEVWSEELVRRRTPGVVRGLDRGLFTREDWKLEPRAALSALRQAALAAGVRFVARSVFAFERGHARFDGGEALAADALVLATGFDSAGLAAEFKTLSPIKGQILHCATLRACDDQPVVRWEGGYAAPARDGLRIGASMEPGRSDRGVTAEMTAALSRSSAVLFPALGGASFVGEAGVRAATPDGLPLVGPSTHEGLFLAAGARRNGWLLAPLVASMIGAYLAGRDPGPFAGAFDARRFTVR